MSHQCPCQGKYDAVGTHYVWIAFLDYENEEYRPEQWLRDYLLFPTNWLTTKFQSGEGSSLFHCQIFFWAHDLDSFLTISVDAYQKHVYMSSTKEFSRGWRFLRIHVTQDQERHIYNYLLLHAKRKTPFNTFGAFLLFLRPIQIGEGAVFCSQLDTLALQQAGFLQEVNPVTTSPSRLYQLIKGTGEFEYDESYNPVRAHQVRKLAKWQENSCQQQEILLNFDLD